MSEQDDIEAMSPIGNRVYTAVTQAIRKEGDRASRKGIDSDLFLRGSLNALLWATAFFACNLISPEETPDSNQVKARTHRLRAGITEALQRGMETELEAIRTKGHA